MPKWGYLVYTDEPTEQTVLDAIKNEDFSYFESKSKWYEEVAEEIFEKELESGYWLWDEDYTPPEDRCIYIVIFEPDTLDYHVIQCQECQITKFFYEEVIID